ncbi:MAG: DoxX family protein [Enterobacteriaceae bacterium]
MPALLDKLTGSCAWNLLARILLTLMFWSSGLAKLFDFNANVLMMESFGLSPGWLFNTLVLLLQIVASVMIIANRGVWLACAALVLFSIAATYIGHPFWKKEGIEAFYDMLVMLGNFSVIGGLMLLSTLSRYR